MFDYLKGTLTQIYPDSITLEVHGVGYRILAPLTHQDLSLNSEMTVYIHTILREPDLILFGFFTKQDRELFQMLINISGVGPKTALVIIGHLPLPQLQTTILTKNLTALTKIPGIGKKTGERLLLELKDKFNHVPQMFDPQASTLIQDAINALTNLGYSPSSSQKAVSEISKLTPQNTSLSYLISSSLKVIK